MSRTDRSLKTGDCEEPSKAGSILSLGNVVSLAGRASPFAEIFTPPPAILNHAVNSLAYAQPEESAKQLLTRRQALLACVGLCVTAALILRWPLTAFIAFNAVTALYFMAAIVFRFWLLIVGWTEKISSAPRHTPKDEDLPVITILLPLYRDAAALPILAQHVDALDYPECKKDVKLLLEEDDRATIEEATRLGLAQRYHIIVIPHCEPRTKPKACNIGLQLARGDLIVIYDAEDQPEPSQLKKAAAAFHDADKELACVQARLNYYNREDNWLTRSIMAQMTERKNCPELHSA